MSEAKKIAQQRSFFNQFRPSNVTRQIAKINPTYKAEYEKLKAADNFIRNNADKFGIPIKDLLSSLKASYKAHRWTSLIEYAKRIGLLAEFIYNNDYVNELLKSRQETFKSFYFSEASSYDDLVKEALFEDLSRKLTDKFFSPFQDAELKKVRAAVTDIFIKAKALGEKILSTYKALDVARAKGSISDYVNVIKSLQRDHALFQKNFDKHYSIVEKYLPKEEEQRYKIEDPELPAEQVTEPVTEQKPNIDTTPFGDFTVVNNPKETEIKEKPISLQDLSKDIEDSYRYENQKIQLEDEDKPEKYPFPLEAEASINNAIKIGDIGLALTLLSKYSQELESRGFITESIEALKFAHSLLGE